VLAPLLLFGRVSPQRVAQAGSAIQPVLQDSWFWALIWLIIAVAGVAFQLRTNATYTFTKQQYVENWG
jgi:hypothetical protein